MLEKDNKENSYPFGIGAIIANKIIEANKAADDKIDVLFTGCDERPFINNEEDT